MKKDSINVLLRNEDIKRAIMNLFRTDLENKEDLAIFFESVVGTSSPATSTFFKLYFGDFITRFPEIGTLGYISCDKLGYGINKDDFLKSDFCRQGFIPVEVVRTRTYADYCPIVVKLPILPSDTHSKETSVEIVDFYVGDVSTIDLSNLK